MENKKTVPGNLSGTLAGVVATFVVGMLSNAGYLAAAATFLGQPEATVSLLAVAIVGGLVNYGVTHVAAIKSLNDIYGMLPQTYPEYPSGKGTPTGTSVTNLKTKDGGRVNG